jgi:cytoskeletal protein CcmA (bactofilin family)
MFGRAKGSSHQKDEPLPPAPQLLTPANLAESDSTDISCIGRGMTVVGKISSEETLNVFGRVEGELHASIVRISDGAQVEGVIAAQDLTIGGHFKGTIQANRVTLTCSAVVEGEIHHRSLAIEENAWFAGVSHGGFDKTMAFSGEPPPNRVVILQFENMAAAKAWQDGNGRATQKIGEKYATFRTFAVEGVEAK